MAGLISHPPVQIDHKTLGTSRRPAEAPGRRFVSGLLPFVTARATARNVLLVPTADRATTLEIDYRTSIGRPRQ